MDEQKGATFRIKRLGEWSDAEAPSEADEDSGFYPAREQFLVDEDVKNGTFLVDFDTGKLFSPPAEDVAEGEMSLLRWVEEKGIDAIAQHDPQTKGLVGLDLAAISVENSEWDMNGLGIEAKGLRAMLGNSKPGNPVEISGLGELPRTYAIRTREGGIGLLQIQGIEDEKLKIRYKMFKPVSQPLPSVPEPVAIATKIMEPLGRGDIERHFELAETPEAERAETNTRIRELDFTDLKVTQAYVGGEESLVIFSSGKKTSYGVQLMKEDDRWKLRDVEVFTTDKSKDSRVSYFRKRVSDATVAVAASGSVYKDVYLHVRGEGRLRFEGRDTNWSEVEELMEAIPDRANTALVVVVPDSDTRMEELKGLTDGSIGRLGFRAVVIGDQTKPIPSDDSGR